MTEQLQSLERQVVEKTSTAEQLQKQNDEMRAQLDSTQQDKDKKKLVFFFIFNTSQSLYWWSKRIQMLQIQEVHLEGTFQ